MNTTDTRILVVDDEESIRFTFRHFLSEEGYSVADAATLGEALNCLSKEPFALVFADIILGGKTGIELLKEIRAKDPQCCVVMITGYPHHDSASEALRLGAFDYISKPVQQDTLLRTAKMALQHRALIDERERYRGNLEAIFKSVKDAIITVDQEFSLMEANEAAGSICGLSRDAIGKRLDALHLHCGVSCLDLIRETIERGEPMEAYRRECHRRDRHGQVVTLGTFPLLKHQHVSPGIVMIVRDETPLVRLEKRLEEKRQFHTTVGKSPGMQTVYSLVESLADIETTVLITGESGTGKELVAEALHHRGSRREKPLVKVNCSALSENLLESELFGHVRGAFTGAIQDRIGRFQRASGGSLFLDEIGDISPAIQLRLLRVLQEKEFERVGDPKPVRIDVRIIAATNRDLREKVRSGEFREDLFYRLRVVEITLPPLRERREDIPLLSDHFLQKFNRKFGRNVDGVSSDVLKVFMDYPWPGNVRELEHAMERAFVVSRHDIIVIDDLQPELREFAGAARGSSRSDNWNDQQVLLGALERAAGNKTRAASLLGMSRRTLYRKIKDLDIAQGD